MIPEGHPLYDDFTVSDLQRTPWAAPDFFRVGTDEHMRERFETRRTRAGRSLTGAGAFVSSAGISLQDAAALEDIQESADFLHLEDDSGPAVYPITAVDTSLKVVGILGRPQLPASGSRWAIGQPVRVYEVFLPTPDRPDDAAIDLTPYDADPVVYGRVGVVAVDDGDRRSRVSAPATVYRVKRTPPSAPAPPLSVEDSANVCASSPDYHGRSSFAVRWRPQAGAKSLIFRALDESVFRADWAVRPRGPLPSEVFPTSPRWDAARRAHVEQQLEELNALAAQGVDAADALSRYRGLSNDALQVLAGLPGTESAFVRLTIDALDSHTPDRRNRPSTSDPLDFELWQPGRPDPDRPLADPELLLFEDQLDGRSRSRYFYRLRFVDGARNLSPMGLSTPPIHLQGDRHPRPPRVVRVVADDGWPPWNGSRVSIRT